MPRQQARAKAFTKTVKTNVRSLIDQREKDVLEIARGDENDIMRHVRAVGGQRTPHERWNFGREWRTGVDPKTIVFGSRFNYFYPIVTEGLKLLKILADQAETTTEPRPKPSRYADSFVVFAQSETGGFERVQNSKQVWQNPRITGADLTSMAPYAGAIEGGQNWLGMHQQLQIFIHRAGRMDAAAQILKQRWRGVATIKSTSTVTPHPAEAFQEKLYKHAGEAEYPVPRIMIRGPFYKGK